MTRRAVRYLATAADPVLLHEHLPDGDAGGPAVLLVPPFGWDDIASYRARRVWGDRLAAMGSPAVRLDLPGTGDSGGGPTDPARVHAWTDAVGAAAAWLRAEHGERRVVAIGLGVGGLIAWSAAAAGAAVDDLVLWGVPARGRTLMRELRAFAAMKADEWGDGAPAPDAVPVTDGFDVTGYRLSGETVDALAAIDLTAQALPEAGRRRLLLLGRDGLPVDKRLRDAADAAGASVTEVPGDGWGAMTSGPQESVVPDAVIAAVAGWLGDGAGAPLAGAPTSPAVLDALPVDGGTERPWRARRSFGEQFGVLATPAGGEPAPLGIVLLNGGAVRHTGPNRMWVEVARRWVARGVPVLRFDANGLGDSDGDSRPYADSARLYEPAHAEQVADAVADLVAAGVASRWVVGGLCAGASWAFHALLRSDERIPAAVLVNPFAFHWEDELVQERDVGATRRLRTAAGWKRLLAGNVTPERVLGVAKHALRTPLERGARADRTRRRVQRDDADLDALRDAGKHLTLLIGRDEPIYERFEREGMLERLPRWPNVELHRLPTRDHTFRAPWLQQVVHEALDAAVEGTLQRPALR